MSAMSREGGLPVQPQPAWGPDRDSLMLSELIRQMSMMLSKHGDMPVEACNDAGDTDTVRSTYTKQTHYSMRVCFISTWTAENS